MAALPAGDTSYVEFPVTTLTFTVGHIASSPSLAALSDRQQLSFSKKSNAERKCMIEVMYETTALPTSFESYRSLATTFHHIVVAIESLHANKIAHMDIKKSNVRMRSPLPVSLPVLTDLGTARQASKTKGYIGVGLWHSRALPVEANFDFDVQSTRTTWDMFGLGLLGLDLLYGDCAVIDDEPFGIGQTGDRDKRHLRHSMWVREVLDMFGSPTVNGKDFRKAVGDKLVEKLGGKRMDIVRERDLLWDPVKAVESKVVCKGERKRRLKPDPHLDRLFVELCLSMMTPDWTQRITAQEALSHEVFKALNVTV